MAPVLQQTIEYGSLMVIISNQLRVDSSSQLRVRRGEFFQPTAGKAVEGLRFPSIDCPVGPFPTNCGKAPGKVNLLICCKRKEIVHWSMLRCRQGCHDPQLIGNLRTNKNAKAIFLKQLD